MARKNARPADRKRKAKLKALMAMPEHERPRRQRHRYRIPVPEMFMPSEMSVMRAMLARLTTRAKETPLPTKENADGDDRTSIF